MPTTAADVMNTVYRTLDVDLPMLEAVTRFRQKGQNGQDGRRRVFGMMVTDAEQRLVGMLSMYDVLLFLRPKHIHIWGMMEDIDVDGVVVNALERLQPLRVGDLMTSTVITISPAAHVMAVLDLMIKNTSAGCRSSKKGASLESFTSPIFSIISWTGSIHRRPAGTVK